MKNIIIIIQTIFLILFCIGVNVGFINYKKIDQLIIATIVMLIGTGINIYLDILLIYKRISNNSCDKYHNISKISTMTLAIIILCL